MEKDKITLGWIDLTPLLSRILDRDNHIARGVRVLRVIASKMKVTLLVLFKEDKILINKKLNIDDTMAHLVMLLENKDNSSLILAINKNEDSVDGSNIENKVIEFEVE